MTVTRTTKLILISLFLLVVFLPLTVSGDLSISSVSPLTFDNTTNFNGVFDLTGSTFTNWDGTAGLYPVGEPENILVSCHYNGTAFSDSFMSLDCYNINTLPAGYYTLYLERGGNHIIKESPQPIIVTSSVITPTPTTPPPTTTIPSTTETTPTPTETTLTPTPTETTLTPTTTTSPFCNIIAHPQEYSILWDYSSCENVINASIDSYSIFGFDATSGVYVLRDLQPNQTHEFTLYDNPYGYFSSKATTLNLAKPEKTSQDKAWDFIYEYLFVIVVISLIVITVITRTPLIGLIAMVFSISGLGDTLSKGNFMLDVIFLVTFISAGTVTYLLLKE